MRIICLLGLVASLGACGVAGAPSHPEADKGFNQQLKLGTTYTV